MIRSRDEAGFTLIELLVVAGMIVVVAATLGVFFLAGPSPAVASAGRDIAAAFAEARETAADFSEATVVFTPAGTGYSARVYRQMPGDPEFQAVNGPTYDSTVAIAETAAPLGTPGFAFRIDSRGSVTGYEHFAPADTTFTTRTCPVSGAFVLSLAYGNQKRTVTIPCTLSLSSVNAGVIVTPAPATSIAPAAPGTCPPSQSCAPPLPTYNATCPPGYTPDATPYVCDSPTPAPTPVPTPTAQATTITASCPPGNGGTYPTCTSSSQSTASPGATQMWYTIIEPTHGGICTTVSDTNEISDALVYVGTGTPPAPGVIFNGYTASGNYISGPPAWLDYRTTITATDGCNPGTGSDPGAPKNGALTTTYTITMNTELDEDTTAYCAIAGCSTSTATDKYNAALAALHYFSTATDAPSGNHYTYAGLGEAVETFPVPPADTTFDCGEEILPGAVSVASDCG